MDESPVLEAQEVALPPSRRGRTLTVAKLVITFDDGYEETWTFPDGAEKALYREGGNRQTKPAAAWKTHQLWWTSDRMVEESNRVTSETPIYDKYGRVTGLVT